MNANQNEARTVILRTENSQIVSVYNRRYLVQHYNRLNGRWFTLKICDNDADARQELRKHLRREAE